MDEVAGLNATTQGALVWLALVKSCPVYMAEMSRANEQLANTVQESWENTISVSWLTGTITDEQLVAGMSHE
jgi:hypothetical protein